GILTTAIKRELLDQENIKKVTDVMAALNKNAAEVMDRYHVNACTDVTGFGLLGHAMEMAEGSQVGITIQYENVPILPRTKELAEQKVVPGGTKKNHAWLAERVKYSVNVDELDQLILCDAITSGGLLISVPETDAKRLVEELRDKNVEAHMIGEVTSENPGYIKVI